jgi:hypothetical protein
LKARTLERTARVVAPTARVSRRRPTGRGESGSAQLIMGRAVALHPLAVILAIATGVVVAGIVGALVAVPLLAVANTPVRYLAAHPHGEPTPDREPPGTRPTDDDQAVAEQIGQPAADRADPDELPMAATSVNPDGEVPIGGAATGA